MTKAEMIEKIAKDAEISKAAATKAYDSFLGGIKGGKARAKKLSAKERSEIARVAALARWKKSKNKSS